MKHTVKYQFNPSKLRKNNNGKLVLHNIEKKHILKKSFNSKEKNYYKLTQIPHLNFYFCYLKNGIICIK